jgi:hypothetical protein
MTVYTSSFQKITAPKLSRPISSSLVPVASRSYDKRCVRWNRESRAVVYMPRPRVYVVAQVYTTTTQAKHRASGPPLPFQRCGEVEGCVITSLILVPRTQTHLVHLLQLFASEQQLTSR